MKIDLKGKWVLNEHGKNDSIPVNVPGDNYSALYAAGKIVDPYYKINEQEVQWVKDLDWEFSKKFTVSDELLDCSSIYLDAEVLDTFALIYINGKKVAATRNMFKRNRIEIKKHLAAGKNEISIVFKSAAKEALKEKSKMPFEIPYSTNNNTVPYVNHIRKVQCHAGWDWGVALMVSGIYGNISINGVNEARIEHIHTTQVHKKNKCIVTATAEICVVKNGTVATEFEFNGESQTVQTKAKSGINIVKAEFEVKTPKLWWPNGYGSQPLYTLTVKTADESIKREIGLRTIELVREKDEIGVGMKFRVNGVDIFCKGANWIPTDAMPERQTAEVYEDLINSAVDANMNMLRVWGGGQYENESFYELCDCKGLLVWQDMMFACSLYPSTDNFLENVKEELEYQIKRLRSHACIAIWCGDNECVGALNWYDNSRDNRSLYIVNYDRLDRERQKMAETMAPEYTYWPSSPCAGPNNYSDNWKNDKAGDMHYWEVWHGSKPIEAFFDVVPRFCSEFGFQSFPSREIFNTFATKEDANVFSPVMEHHQKCPKGNGNIINMFGHYFRLPNGFDNFLYLSQVTQALAIKTGVEHWRHLMPVCMGTVYWQLNDNWPVASWSSIEYGGKWKQLHYHAKRFFAQAITSTFQKDGNIEIWSVNDLRQDMEFSVTATAYDFSGEVVKEWDFPTKVKKGSSKKLKTLKLDELEFKLNEAFMVIQTKAKGKNKTLTHTNTHFFDKYKRCPLADADVKVEAIDGNGGFEVVLKTDKPAFFVNIEAVGIKGNFEDNSITLLPGKTKLKFIPKQDVALKDFQKSLKIKHLRQTY